MSDIGGRRERATLVRTQEGVPLDDETRRWTAQLEALRQVGLELTAELDLDTLLNSIASRAVELLNGTWGGLFLHRPDRDVLEWIVAVGASPVPLGQVLHHGEGLAGRVWDDGEPLIVDDYRTWSGRSATFERFPITAVVSAPVRWRGQFLGVLNVVSDTPKTFSANDAELLSLLAAHAAIAIRNARTLAAEEQQRRRAEALARATSALTSTLDLEQLLENVLAAAIQAIPMAQKGSVLLLASETNELHVRVTAGYTDPRVQTLRFTMDMGYAVQAVREGLPVLIPDARAEPLRYDGEIQEIRDLQSAIAAPLRYRDQVIGVLSLDNARQKSAFTEDDLNLLATFADQAAVAVEHARLYQETRLRAERMAVVNRIARAASATLHLDDLLEAVYQELVLTFRPAAAFIALYDEQTDELDFRLQVDEDMRTPPERRPIEPGLTSFVVTEKKALLIRNMEEERDGLPPIRLWGTMELPLSWLGSPMCIGERVVGVISVQAYEANVYGAEEQLLLSTIADQVAMAVDNARLYEQERRRAVQASLLNTVAQQINTIMPPQSLLPAIAETIQQHFAYDSVALLLTDPARSDLVVAGNAGVGQDAFPRNYRQPLGQGIIGWVASHGEPLLVNDTSNEERYIAAAPDRYRAGSELAVPLRIGDDIVGVLDVQRRRTDGFDDLDVATARTLAEQVAVAIDNARLYQKAQRHADELTAALARSRELDRLKSEFIQNVSHELRSPLALVRGYAELLASGDLGKLTPEQLGPAEIIARRTRMLSELVEDITLILLAEARALEKKPLALSDLVRAAVEDFAVSAQHARLTLVADIAPDLPPVSGASVYLRRVLDNLISNAIKFTQPGGTVTVRLRRQAGWIVLQVADTGIGIPPEQQKRVFERFYQVDGSMQRSYGGVGLGLALVKEIIEAYGGQVSLTSQVDHGSTFTVRLPVY